MDGDQPQFVDKDGERGRNRTSNLLIKSQLLCQLSYAPAVKICWMGQFVIVAFPAWTVIRDAIRPIRPLGICGNATGTCVVSKSRCSAHLGPRSGHANFSAAERTARSSRKSQGGETTHPSGGTRLLLSADMRSVKARCG